MHKLQLSLIIGSHELAPSRATRSVNHQESDIFIVFTNKRGIFFSINILGVKDHLSEVSIIFSSVMFKNYWIFFT